MDNKFDKIIEQKREDLVNGNTESDRKDLLLNAEACEDPEYQNLTNIELRVYLKALRVKIIKYNYFFITKIINFFFAA